MDETITRRAIITAASASALAVTGACAQTPSTIARGRSLVVYFSRSGNTRVIAGGLSRSLGAPLAEIVPVRPYPEDYEATVAQSARERSSNYHPPLMPLEHDLADYEEVFLGFPIWGTSLPPAVRSFLSAQTLSGITLVPFITHGGFGAGTSLDELGSLAPDARRLDPFVLECDQERRTLEAVKHWLGDLRGPAGPLP